MLVTLDEGLFCSTFQSEGQANQEILGSSGAVTEFSNMGTTVEEIMSWQVVAVELDATLDHVVHLMETHDFKSFPVIDRENHVRGIIARDDVVRALDRSTRRSPLPLGLQPMGYAIA